MAIEPDSTEVSKELFSLELDDDNQFNDIKVTRFPTSEKYCVSLDGNQTPCRRPCIDVSTVYRQDEDGDTLLHIAIINLEADIASYFIESTPCPDWLNIKKKLSQNPLHVTVLTNQIPIARQLIVAGVDVNARDRHGNTALHLACRDGFVEITRALLKLVSFEEQQRNNYIIPFENLHARTNLNLLNFEGLSCLHLAASNNHIEIIKILLHNGAHVNMTEEKSGRTILHEAAYNGNLELVRLLVLLDRSCDINAKTYDGFTPFDLARARGHWAVVAELAKLDREAEEEYL